ncbi:hypothetical protein CL655_03680 [bacterium]|nr:hypothetical protein [bacterium]|tara:strand:+ start:2983 stop:3513 length:531 start_codon:yes stop_codon:yes gene_type:complete
MSIAIRSLIVGILLSGLAVKAEAFTREQAQQCAEALLGIYVDRRNPLPFLDINGLTETALGANNRDLLPRQRDLARRVATELIPGEFAEATRFTFSSPTIRNVDERNSGGWTAHGVVDVIDTEENRRFLNASVLAIVTSASPCRVRQVRIGEIRTLTAIVRSMLRSDRRTRSFFRD